MVSLLWVATAVAVSARIRSRGRARRFLLAVLAALTMVLVAPLALSAQMNFGIGLAESWFGYCLSLFIAAFLGGVIILWLARRHPARSRCAGRRRLGRRRASSCCSG